LEAFPLATGAAFEDAAEAGLERPFRMAIKSAGCKVESHEEKL
jgi:hypothetical protein